MSTPVKEFYSPETVGKILGERGMRAEYTQRIVDAAEKYNKSFRGDIERILAEYAGELEGGGNRE